MSIAEAMVSNPNLPKIYIVPVGAVTALGNLAETWQGLLQARTAISCFDEEAQDFWGYHGPVAPIPGIAATTTGKRRVKKIISLLSDEIKQAVSFPENTGLVVATTKGAVDDIVSHGMKSPVAPDKLELQPWNLGAHVAEMIGVKGPVSTVSAACASGTVAIIQAAMRILNGEAAHMLVVGVDVLSRFVISGFHVLQALSRSVCRPFDTRRDGLVLGEGAAALFLSSDSRLKDMKNSATLSGWGISCDAVHITAPARDARGLVSCLEALISMSDTGVGGINAHGTGTVYNDAMEILAFSRVFGETSMPPFHSVKGSIGHCLGGAGVIEACISLCSLSKGVIPPTAGLEEREAHHVTAQGDVPARISYPSIISCNSGFGGVNAAVLLSVAE